MPFVANRELKVISRGLDPVTTVYKAGDVIPDFAKWPEVPRRAHLNMEWVSKVKEEDLVAQPKEAGSKKKASKKVTVGSVKKTEAVKQEAETFECPLDGKTFKSPKALKTHTTLAHKNRE